MILQDERKQKALLYTTLVAGCMATINTSTVNIALPTFIEIFHTDLSTAQWLMIGYMLALGIVMPMVGYFGERYSYRRMYLTALFFMAVFALGCALSCNIGMLILFRILKGLAAGFILPCTMTLLYRYIPREKQASFLGLSVTFSSLGVTIGPSISGFLLTFFNWHSLFLVNLPLIAAAYLLARSSIPQEAGVHKERLDLKGMALMALGTVSILIGFTEVEDWGWSSPLFWACLVLGVGLIAAFVRLESRSSEPLLNFKVLQYRPFAVTAVVTAAVNITFTITPLLMAVYLQTIQGHTAFAAGLIMLVPSAVMVLATSLARKLIRHFSNKQLILTGLGLAACGNFMMHFAQMDSALWFIIPMLSLRFFGVGLLNMPLTDYGMRELPPELAGHGSSMLNWCKQIASVIWLSMLTALLTISTRFFQQSGIEAMQASMSGVNMVFFTLAAALAIIWAGAWVLFQHSR